MRTAAGDRRAGEAQRLRGIRAALDGIRPGDWRRAADERGELIEARDAHGHFVPVLRFEPAAAFDEIVFAAEAPAMVAFLLGLLDRAIRAARAADRTGGGAHGRDFAAEAAMRCQEPAFKAYLAERHGLERPLSDERAAQKLRSLLGVTTRRALNEDAAAAERWRRLRADFQAWRARP